MTNAEHIENIVFRTRIGRTQESWFEVAGIQSDPVAKLFLLALTSSSQVLAAWALSGDTAKSDAEFVVNYMEVAKGVARALAPQYMSLVGQDASGVLSQRVSDPDGMETYLLWCNKQVLDKYNSWSQLGNSFRDSLGPALTDFMLEQGTLGNSDDARFLGAIRVALGLAEDYIVSFS